MVIANSNGRARVEIIRTCCHLEVDRTYPMALDGHLSEPEWDAFCNDIQRKLHFINIAVPLAVVSGLSVFLYLFIFYRWVIEFEIALVFSLQ